MVRNRHHESSDLVICVPGSHIFDLHSLGVVGVSCLGRIAIRVWAPSGRIVCV